MAELNQKKKNNLDVNFMPIVHAKNEVYGLTLAWAYNLFVMWVLDFLLWVVLNAETQ